MRMRSSVRAGERGWPDQRGIITPRCGVNVGCHLYLFSEREDSLPVGPDSYRECTTRPPGYVTFFSQKKMFNHGFRGFHGSMLRPIRAIRAIRGHPLFPLVAPFYIWKSFQVIVWCSLMGIQMTEVLRTSAVGPTSVPLIQYADVGFGGGLENYLSC